jgi:hypothetical protein
MTKFNLTLIALAATVMAAPLLAGSANASVTSKLGKCKFDSRDKTMNCCDQIMKKAKNVPMWWPTESRSCSAAGVVVCAGGKRGTPGVTAVALRRQKCWVQVQQNDTPSRNNGSSERQTERPSRPTTQSDSGPSRKD